MGVTSVNVRVCGIYNTIIEPNRRNNSTPLFTDHFEFGPEMEVRSYQNQDIKAAHLTVKMQK